MGHTVPEVLCVLSYVTLLEPLETDPWVLNGVREVKILTEVTEP